MLKDPAFWSTVIAVVALILSQLPPVTDLLKPRELRIVVPDILNFSHYMGNLHLIGFSALHNVGGRNITVQKIECVMTDEEGRQWRLPAQTYLPNQANSGSGQPAPELFIGWISLKPGEHWAETVRFFKVWSVQDEEDATAISGRIRNDITAKLSQRKLGDPNKLVEADENLVKEAKDFFEKRFTLAKGTYRLLVAAISEGNEVVRVRGFDFTLFDHQVRALRSAVDDYKTGAGIYFGNMDPSKTAYIRLRPIPDTEAQKDYARLPVL